MVFQDKKKKELNIFPDLKYIASAITCKTRANDFFCDK